MAVWDAGLVKTLDNAGITSYVQVEVTDLGIEKVKGVRATDEQIARLVAKAKEVLAQA
jgi:uncharacterized metal-binding protein